MAFLVTTSQALPLLPRSSRGQKGRHRGGAGNPSPHWGSSLHFRKLPGSFRDQAFGDRRCVVFLAAAGVLPLVLLFCVLTQQWITTLAFLKSHALQQTKAHSFDAADSLAAPAQRHGAAFISRLHASWLHPFAGGSSQGKEHRSGSRLGAGARGAGGQGSTVVRVTSSIQGALSATGESGTGAAGTGAPGRTQGDEPTVLQAGSALGQAGGSNAVANGDTVGGAGSGGGQQKGAEPGAANGDRVGDAGAVGAALLTQTEGSARAGEVVAAGTQIVSGAQSEGTSVQTAQQGLSAEDDLLIKRLAGRFERYGGFEAHKEDFREVLVLHKLMAPLAAAGNNTVVVIPANDGFMDFAMNVWCRLQELRAPNVLIWAFDSPAAKKLQAKGIPYYYDPTLYSISERRAYEDEEYIRLMSNKPRVWWKMLATGFDLLFLDADSAIFDRPEKAFNMTLDIEGQYDAWHFMEEAPLVRETIMCAGAVWFRSNTATLRTMDYVIDTFSRNHTKRWDDQVALNDAIRNPNMTVLKDNWLPDPPGSELVRDRARVGYIQLTKILSGHTFWFIKHFPQKGFDGSEKMTICLHKDPKVCMPFWPVVIHFNGCCVQEERRNIMQKNGWWRVNTNNECAVSSH